MIAYVMTGVVLIASYYYVRNSYRKQVDIHFLESQYLHNIIKKCPSFLQFNPNPLYNGLLHTVIASLKKPIGDYHSKREYIEDSGISVDWVINKQEQDNKRPLLFIMPGLTGKVSDAYIDAIINEAHKQNIYNICVYNYRLFSDNFNFEFQQKFQDYGMIMEPRQFENNYLTDGFYGIDNDFYFMHPDIIAKKRSRVDLPADLHYTLSYIKQKYQHKEIYVIGCSYGGIQLSNYLGRFKDVCLVDKGVVIGSPLSIIIADRYVTNFMSYAITKILTKAISKLRHLYDKVPSNWNVQLDQAQNSTWLRDFDSLFSARIFGYKDIDSYYRHFSPVNRFREINIPMLVITALDDGLCHPKSLCIDEMICNGKTIMLTTKTGGHVAQLNRNGEFWFPKASLEFLVA